MTPPSGGEVKQFRAGLEAHWGGNLPALLAYLQSIDPGAGDNPEPPEQGGSAHWAPDEGRVPPGRTGPWRESQ